MGKKRIYEIAKELNISSQELLKELKELDIEVKSHASTLSEEEYELIKELYLGEKEKSKEKEKKESKDKLIPRPPVVTVMGHVDHGKTTLLDAIRKTNFVAQEYGEITQHIGAYQVELPQGKITFIDTPGHEAFTTLRARGAQVTDIVVLVIAADDGIQPQTIEAINHAKNAGTPIVVAINKIDKPNANPQKVKTQLMEYGLIPEEMGGDVLVSEISALKKIGIEDLLENILLQAELLELKADPNVPAKAVIIETRISKGEGPCGTVIVKEGTLKVGQPFIAGLTWGKVRRMKNYKGETLKEAPPSTPVEVLGFESLPQAGDTLEVVKNEREAKKIAEERIRKTKRTQRSPTLSWELIKEKLEGKEVKEIPVIIKGDTQGSVEALRSSLEKLSNEEIKIKCIHEGVGNVNRSDVLLAYTARGIIIGFNVGKENEVESLSRTYGVKINIYRLIYDAIQETEKFINSLKAPALEQVKIGEAEIRRIFQVPKWGKVAGCYVLSGKVRRGAECRIKRGDDVIFEGVLSSLKRFKDDVKEVSEGYECGIGFEGFTDFQEGDVVEVFEWREKPR
ncbi:MAG TPA: translation initiation factor IF-2 [bacterium]|nr:translation initiation factor IF-2 [bacterium]HEX67503.1 translation initiation factor IF-2 [bacterium]